ncbi:MAG: TIGR02147 family protein [Fibrobacterales bacterium]
MRLENLYKYIDYREYIKEYYRVNKESRFGFSYRAFSKKAGFSSPSFIRLVIEGEKNLTKNSVLKLSHAMELNTEECEFFEDLVFFGQAKIFDEKQHYLTRIDLRRDKNDPSVLKPAQFDYLKDWYNPLLLEMVSVNGFEEDPVKIASMIPFEVTPKQVKAALEFLIQNGFLERDGRGKLVKVDKTLATGPLDEQEVLQILARSFHKKMTELAVEAVTRFSKEQRNTTNTTLSFSRKSYQLATERIKAMRYELLELAASDDETDTVYQLNVNLFPLMEKK